MMSREFEVTVDGRLVPGIAWFPEGVRTRTPLLLVGHGGSQDKDHPGIIDIASRFVQNHGITVAAIDGPIHGARRASRLNGPAMQAEFLLMWKENNHIDSMVADWQAAIDHLTSWDKVNPDVIGWYGISMGTAYGLPLTAADGRIKAALLGMWGEDFSNSRRLADDAPRVRCPVLFQQKWDDQLFTREGQLNLFDKLGSEEKWLKIYPGAHVPVAGEQLLDIEEFFIRRLMI